MSANDPEHLRWSRRPNDQTTEDRQYQAKVLVTRRLPRSHNHEPAAHIGEAVRLRNAWRDLSPGDQAFLAEHAPDVLGAHPAVPLDVRTACNKRAGRVGLLHNQGVAAPWANSPMLLRDSTVYPGGRHDGRIYGTRSPTDPDVGRVVVHVAFGASPLREAEALRALAASSASDQAALILVPHTKPEVFRLPLAIADLLMSAAIDFPTKPLVIGGDNQVTGAALEVLAPFIAARQARDTAMAPVSVASVVEDLAGVSVPAWDTPAWRSTRYGIRSGLSGGKGFGAVVGRGKRSPAPGMN